jgi:threonine dehydrogenase-like Zn-dependent dehydrogenase
MKAAAWTRDRNLAVEDRPEPLPESGETVVRVMACGICGSDLHFFRGEIPPRPGLVPGHEIAGVVEGGDGLPAATPVAVEPLIGCGECAYCRSGQPQLCGRSRGLGMWVNGGMQQLLAVPADYVYRLPEGVSPDAAAMTEPLAVCVRGVHLAATPHGARVLVLGAGTIGLLTAMLLREVASEVAITARYPHQREAALKLGASAVFEPGSPDLAAWSQVRRPEVVIETVGGHAGTLSEAIHSVAPGGTVVTLGVFTGDQAIPAYRLVSKEVRLLGSLMYARAGARSEFGMAVDLLPRYRQEIALLQTARFPLAQANEAFEAAADKHRGALKVTVLPNA